MDDGWLLAGGLLLIAAQIGCLFAKMVWVRLVPVFIIAALMVFCIAMYAAGGWTNWGYLILLALITGVQLLMGLVWLVYGIVCRIRKTVK